jgi:hypothetical protein
MRPEPARTSSRGVRMVAITSQPRAAKWRAISRPKPVEHPVINMVGIVSPVVDWHSDRHSSWTPYN